MPGELLKEFMGRVIKEIEGEKGSERLIFHFEEGRSLKMYHEADCCEAVWLEDVTGEMSDLIDTPIVVAEMWTEEGEPMTAGEDSCTWTFYKFRTHRGDVTLRWNGESNGYYSEDVSIAVQDGDGWVRLRTPYGVEFDCVYCAVMYGEHTHA